MDEAGDLPPSSRVTGVRSSVAVSITNSPTFIDLVKTVPSRGGFVKAVATSTSPVITSASSSENVSLIILSSSSPVRGANFDVLILPRCLRRGRRRAASVRFTGAFGLRKG